MAYAYTIIENLDGTKTLMPVGFDITIWNMQLTRMQAYLPNETNEVILQDCLLRAASAISERRKSSQMEYQYLNLQIDIAIYLYNKQGAEGEVSHSEGGVSQSYENSYIPESMLSHVVPYVKVLS